MGVSLSDAKRHLGIPVDVCIDDDRISLFLVGVRELVDDYLGTPLVRKTLTQRFEGTHQQQWILNAAPVASITSILDPAGNTIAADRYALVEELGIITHYGYPPRAVRSDGSLDRWTVTYVAGHFATENEVPYRPSLAILDLISSYYHVLIPNVQAQRDASGASMSLIPNPTALEILPRRAQVALSGLRRHLS